MTALEALLAIVSAVLLLRCAQLAYDRETWRLVARMTERSLVHTRRAVNLHWSIEHPDDPPIQWPHVAVDSRQFELD